MRGGLDQLAAMRRGDLTAPPIPLRELPREWFSASENLRPEGWPDFSIRCLADWGSSARPAPGSPDDCCLVLACTRVVPVIEAADGWALVSHQTGGAWLEQKNVAVRKQTAGRKGLQIIHRIARAMAQSNCSAEFALFDQLIEYRNHLNRFGLDCNHHIQALTEGFYPVDRTEEALQILEVLDPPPEALADLGNGGICLAIMAPNCSDW